MVRERRPSKSEGAGPTPPSQWVVGPAPLMTRRHWLVAWSGLPVCLVVGLFLRGQLVSVWDQCEVLLDAGGGFSLTFELAMTALVAATLFGVVVIGVGRRSLVAGSAIGGLIILAVFYVAVRTITPGPAECAPQLLPWWLSI